MKRILMLAALCVLLAACFKSERLLLDLGTAAHPVPEGDWAADDVSFSLAIQGDHYVRTEDKNKYDVVLAPLAGHPDTFVAAESSEGCTGHDATPECNWEYAIVVVGKDGTWKQFAPDCKQDWEGMDRDVAKREDDGDTCWFDDAAGLQHALSVSADRGGSNEQVFHRPDQAPPEDAAAPAVEPAKQQ
jgi:hypothetical protein